MDEYVRLTCPNCARSNLKVRATYLGQLVRCKHCEHTFRAAGGADPDPEAGGPEADDLRRRLPALEAALAEAERRRDEAAARVVALEFERDDLRAAAREAGALRAERDALRADRDRLAGAHAELRARADDLAADADRHRREGAARGEAADAHAAEARSLRAALDEAAAAADALRADRDRLAAEVGTLHSERESFLVLINRLEDALAAAQHDEATLTASTAAERDALAAEHDQFIAERDALAAERDRLASDRDALAAERDRLASDRDALAAVRDELGPDRDHLAAERDALTAERDTLASRLDALTAERDELVQNRDQLTRERGALWDALSELKEERDGLSGERVAWAIEREQLASERDALLARLESLHADGESVRQGVEALAAERDALRAGRDTLAAASVDLALALEVVGDRAARVEEEAVAQQNDHGQARDRLREAEAERDALRAEVERLRAEAAAARAERAAGPVVHLPHANAQGLTFPPGGWDLPPLEIPDLDLDLPLQGTDGVEPTGTDSRIELLVNECMTFRNQIARLTDERDALAREVDRLRASGAGAFTPTSGVDEAALARVSAALQRETDRAAALQAKLDAVYAEALVDLTDGEDDADESLVLARSLAEARAENDRLRARLAALGEPPDDPGGPLTVRMW